MPASLLSPVRGLIAALCLVLNTIFWCSLVFVLAPAKRVVPADAARRRIDPLLNRLAVNWVSGNSAWMRLTQRTEWDVEGVEDLDLQGWYMVNCNHQSWVDIFVLQHVLNRRIPLLKFFLKQQLIWVPVIGVAWWALDFPFMRRHSDAYLRANPEKRFEDLEASRKACEKFAATPTSVMNFPEGTRFSVDKHAAQRSPYRHLLKPRAGAMALALSVLGDRFRAFVDVTIVYPGGVPTFWDFLCGRLDKVVVRVHCVEIPESFVHGDYASDSRFRKSVQRWQQERWLEKDREIDSLLVR